MFIYNVSRGESSSIEKIQQQLIIYCLGTIEGSDRPLTQFQFWTGVGWTNLYIWHRKNVQLYTFYIDTFLIMYLK